LDSPLLRLLWVWELIR